LKASVGSDNAAKPFCVFSDYTEADQAAQILAKQGQIIKA